MRIQTLVALYFWILEFGDVTCISSISETKRAYMITTVKNLAQCMGLLVGENKIGLYYGKARTCTRLF